MKTITALELREDLKSILARASRGETVRITYKNKFQAQIGPVQTPKQSNASRVFAANSEVSKYLSSQTKRKLDDLEYREKIKEEYKYHRYLGNL